MKPNRTITWLRVPMRFFQMRSLLVVAIVFINSTVAIRVYDGTNFLAPTIKSHKPSGLPKKFLYLSKRSWNPVEDKLIAKSDRRLDENGEANKRLGAGAPSLYKIKFADKNLMQYLRYIKEIPRLEEYTFCMWYKSNNLTHDQTLFSYSLNKNELLLRFWISGLESTLKMAIRENPVYKVSANLRERKWHHVCQSWNGVSGEWQVFLDGKRIGAGLLSHYKGTYIPEGGEVTLGQELVGLQNRLDDGMDGEIFGFNLVDEAVPQDQAVFINSQYKPNIQAALPPFKKLPPIKKTYQEIKAYITSLPTNPSDELKINEEFSGEVPSVIKKPKETHSRPSKRNRGQHKHRYPPMRKVVIYNREDRQLPLEEAVIELNRTRPAAKNQTLIKDAKNSNGENHSIHSYHLKKDERKNTNYEIYETVEDDFDKTNDQSLERKARQNFNLFQAREANKVYTLSGSVKNLKKPKFHFETEEIDNRRSFDVKEKITQKEPSQQKQTDSDVIPVYETEINSDRKKRSTEEKREPKQFAIDYPLTDSNGFRRLPQIPESFINIFAKNSSKSEIEKTLDKFFPQSITTNETIVTIETTEAPKTTFEESVEIYFPAATDTQIKRIASQEQQQPLVPDISLANTAPAIRQISTVESLSEMKPAVLTSGLTDSGPVNFPVAQEFNPGRPREETSSSFRYIKQAQTMEKRRFDISSGTDLVMRSYGECTVDRGSPIRDKQRLVISWADTPVRIFGGAQVEAAKNQCGYF